METDLSVREKAESNVQFSGKLLKVIFFIGIIGAVLTVGPYVFTIDNDLPAETISNIGNNFAIIAEIVFISLISYKIYKEELAKPSYALLACYAGVIGLDFLVNLISEEIGFITSIIYALSTIGTGLIFLMAKETKKIGMWLLLSIAGFIILLAIISNDEFENTHKGVGKILAALYCGPYAKYLESCEEFLAGAEKDKNNKRVQQ